MFTSVDLTIVIGPTKLKYLKAKGLSPIFLGKIQSNLLRYLRIHEEMSQSRVKIVHLRPGILCGSKNY